MDPSPSLQEPAACSDAELLEFEQLVRRGFAGSDARLPERIRAARRLAFHRTDGSLTAIAGLKVPAEAYRDGVFKKAGVRPGPAAYGLELGWVFVVPELRGRGIARHLCAQLMAGVMTSGVFATTRPDNLSMIKILAGLGFKRTGSPFLHVRREEHLALYLLQPGD